MNAQRQHDKRLDEMDQEARDVQWAIKNHKRKSRTAKSKQRLKKKNTLVMGDS